MTMLRRVRRVGNGGYRRQLAVAVLAWASVIGLTGCAAGSGGGGGGDGDDAAAGELVGQPSASTPSGAVGEGAGDATVGQVVTLVASASGGTPPYYYDWWIEDGPEDPEITDPESARASVTFTEAGAYTIGLIITDDEGAEVRQFFDIGVSTETDGGEPADDEEPSESANPLAEVRFWAYQIGGLENDGAIEPLVQSRYDLLVLEPTRSDRENTDFDTAGMVDRLHESEGSTAGSRKLVAACIDIGEAEDWRIYWEEDWVAPTEEERGDPDFLVTVDPDGWSGNYPVAYWDDRWKEIMIYGEDSVLQQVLDDGFDGIYMDWVEAYSDEMVMAAAQAGDLDPAQEMIDFIREIREYARARNPQFAVIPQNAAEILEFGGEDYLELIDAIAQEQIFFDGNADTEWDDPDSGDHRVPDLEEGEDGGYSRAFYEGWLEEYLEAGKVVLSVDYAAEPDNVAEAYDNATANRYIPYVSRRPLDRLTDTPPPGLPD